MRAKLESANAKREHQKKAWIFKRIYKKLHKNKNWVLESIEKKARKKLAERIGWQKPKLLVYYKSAEKLMSSFPKTPQKNSSNNLNPKERENNEPEMVQ